MLAVGNSGDGIVGYVWQIEADLRGDHAKSRVRLVYPRGGGRIAPRARLRITVGEHPLVIAAARRDAQLARAIGVGTDGVDGWRHPHGERAGHAIAGEIAWIIAHGTHLQAVADIFPRDCGTGGLRIHDTQRVAAEAVELLACERCLDGIESEIIDVGLLLEHVERSVCPYYMSADQFDIEDGRIGGARITREDIQPRHRVNVIACRNGEGRRVPVRRGDGALLQHTDVFRPAHLTVRELLDRTIPVHAAMQKRDGLALEFRHSFYFGVRSSLTATARWISSSLPFSAS